MTGADRSDHWLWRLDAEAWLRAARIELDAAVTNLRSRRTAVTHARRGAGMALNAVLVALDPGPGHELRWGRSYIDHLRAIASADDDLRRPLSSAAQTAAAGLLAIPVVPNAALVQLGHGPDSAARQAIDLARTLTDECAAIVKAHPPSS